MRIRLRFDISLRELAWGGATCLGPSRRAPLQERAERQWKSTDPVIPVLSVRSAFDLMLSALELPATSEVLMSALTVPDMVRIVEQHGLVPLPVDLTERGTAPSLASLKLAVTPTTRALVIAHLFGARIDLAPYLAFAREHNLLLIEDCAQAYDGLGYCGDERTDASLFSFGPIKTATALRGGVIRLRSRLLAERIRRLHASYPVEGRCVYGQRLLKYAALKTLATRPCFSLISACCDWMGSDPDRVVVGAARNFPADALFQHVRQQPSEPLLRMMIRRWCHYPRARLERRRDKGAWFAEQFPSRDWLLNPHQTLCNTFWVFPVLVSDPGRAVEVLRRAGFDATQRTRLAIVPAPPDRPELEAVELKRTLQQLVFLPWDVDMPERLLRRMVSVLRDAGVCGVPGANPLVGAQPELAPTVDAAPSALPPSSLA